MKEDLIEQLYKRYHRELYIYALSLAKDQYEAQDLVSETFFKALLTVDEETSYFKYWLFRVCKNLFLDKLRKNKHDRNINHIILSSKETPLDRIIEDQEKRDLFKAVMSLPETYREVIVLYYYNSFSVREISQQIGASESSIKVLLYRARKKLKIRLEEENEL
nr:sigma-70 family RNA polymerase sigma factor [Tissierella sp.]